MESQLIELTIEDMSVEGQGIGKIDSGMVVFVEGGLTGDRVRAQLTKVKKNFAFAKAMDAVARCDRVIDTDFPIGSANRRIELLLQAAESAGKLERR